MGAAEIGRPTCHQDVTGIPVIRPRHDFHQRRFARRIVADQPQDFAGIKPEINIAQRLHGSESLADAAHIYNWRGVHGF